MRPTAHEVRSALAKGSVGHVSHDPRGGDDEIASGWLEILVDGLTFDLLGLAPGRAASAPRTRHHFGLPAQAIAGCEAIAIAPGPHLAGAANAMPVVRTLTRLASALAEQWNTARAAIWAPAASAIDRQVFVRSIDSWLGGGPFPALGLTAVGERPDGALGSQGLAFFTGQELVLDRALSEDRLGGTRLLVRLIDSLVDEPALTQEGAIAFGDGASLRLRPEGAVVRVTRG